MKFTRVRSTPHDALTMRIPRSLREVASSPMDWADQRVVDAVLASDDATPRRRMPAHDTALIAVALASLAVIWLVL